MQFDTIKVSSFYRDHGVLGRKSIKNRKYWVQTVPFCIRNKNTVVSNGIRKYFKSQLLNCPFYQFIRPFYHKIFFLGLDGFSNLNEFQFEGNWRFYIIYIVYFSSLRFPTKTSSSHTYIVIITTFTFDNILTVDKKKVTISLSDQFLTMSSAHSSLEIQTSPFWGFLESQLSTLTNLDMTQSQML